jgi:thiol-disulfide isomerase/thioredoxin
VNPDRRVWALAAGAATAAASAGVGWALWRQRGGGAGAEQGVVDALWSSSFESPNGGRLVLASLRGRPLVLNFWATWCPPCIREMPTLDRFQRDFAARGWRVVGLAADKLEPVREFLARAPVSYPIGLTGFAGIDLSRRLGNSGGGLPFTLVLGGDGAPVQRHIGEVSYERLAGWAKASG